MAAHNDSSDFSSNRGQTSTSRQLPGLHELLSPNPPGGLHAPAPDNRHGSLPQISSLAGPQQWPSISTFHSSSSQPLARQDLNGGHASGAPFGLNASIQPGGHTSHYTRQPYAAPISRPPPPAQHHDYRGSMSGPFSDTPMDDLRRDSARSTSSNSLTGTAECIGQQHFPGRGLCYVYRDGATCPTVIDGEIVNPLWGTTKAGKARKRLAQACLSCREKKIRCEPSFPRCAQCEKSKRECIMPTTQHGQPELTTTGPQNTVSTLHSLSPISPATMSKPGSDPFANPMNRLLTSAKRRRSNEMVSGTNNHDVSTGITMRPKFAPTQVAGHNYGHDELGRIHDRNPRDVSSTSVPYSSTKSETPIWHHDPYEASQEGTLSLLDGVFVQAMAAFNHMVPHATFRKWVIECRTKTQDECMVLYSMLALGAAMGNDHSSFSRLCIKRANAAMESSMGKFSLLLAQARIYMTQFAHAQGQADLASEYTASAAHVLRAEGLVSEDFCTAPDRYTEMGVFGMNAHQVVECKRRTLWAGYVADQFSTAYTFNVCNFTEGQIYLRHPCPEDDFERGLPSRAPFFQPIQDALPEGLLDRSITSPLAHVSNIVRLIGGQSCFMFPRLRVSLLSSPGHFSKDYETFLRELDERLSAWLTSLPPDLRITDTNFRVVVEKSDVAIAFSVTALYHIAIIKATRFTKHNTLNQMLVERNIQRAYQSAQEVLHLTGELCAFAQNLPEGQNLQSIIPPFLSYSIALAVDTVCAGGHFKDLRGLLSIIMNACTIVASVAYVWPRAQMVQHFIEKRISDLQELERSTDRIPAGFRIVGNVGWRCSVAYRRNILFEDDIIYGTEDGQFLQAIAV